MSTITVALIIAAWLVIALVLADIILERSAFLAQANEEAMTDLKKLIALARSREDEPGAHEYIEPLCFALEGLMLEMELLRNLPAVKLETTEIAAEAKDESIPDHPFHLLDHCQEKGCNKTIDEHESSVWLESILRVKLETLKWAYKQCSASTQSYIGGRKIWTEVKRLEDK
jgi:hypothetical protein